MFESALITRAGGDREIDLGVMAETMFFYRSTHLLLNRGSITALAKSLSADDLITLFDQTGTKISYIRPTFGVVKAGFPPARQFVAFTFGGDQQRKIINYKEEVSMTLERELGNTRSTKHLVKSINDRLSQHRFPEAEKETVITKLAIQDAGDKQFIRKAILLILQHLVPDYEPSPQFRFVLMDTGQGFAVDTNLDFHKANALYHRHTPPEHSSITSEYLLAHLISARSESYFAAHYMSEIVTTPVYGRLINLKHFDFLRRRDANLQEAVLFQDTILPDFPTIAEAISSKQRSVSEFLELMEKANKFKQWLNGVNPDEGLIRSYYKASTEKTWADRMPTKSIRFSIATGLGLVADMLVPTGVGTAVGVAAGAADSLYLDRLIKGWRPNQFIEGPLTDFLGKRRAAD